MGLSERSVIRLKAFESAVVYLEPRNKMRQKDLISLLTLEMLHELPFFKIPVFIFESILGMFAIPIFIWYVYKM